MSAAEMDAVVLCYCTLIGHYRAVADQYMSAETHLTISILLSVTGPKSNKLFAKLTLGCVLHVLSSTTEQMHSPLFKEPSVRGGTIRAMSGFGLT